MFFANATVVHEPTGGFRVVTNPKNINRVLHCKRRWIGKSPSEVLATEFGIQADEVPVFASQASVPELIPDIHVIRKSKVTGHDSVLIDGDELHISTLITEPEISVHVLPFMIENSEHFLVTYKPHALPTTPQGKFMTCNLHTQLQTIFPGQYLQPINRLDRCTAGVVIFAKSPEVFANHKVHEKIYFAKIDKRGVDRFVGFEDSKKTREINLPLTVEKHVPNQTLRTAVDLVEGKEAVTRVSRCFEGGYLRCEPVTGRTHQIRVHLASSGAPIIGDSLYDSENPNLLSQPEEVCLFAWRYQVELEGNVNTFQLQDRSCSPAWLRDAPGELFDLSR